MKFSWLLPSAVCRRLPRVGWLAVACTLPFAAPRALHAQFGSGCETYVTITEYPAYNYYDATASFRVEWGENTNTTPACFSTGDPTGFVFTVNGVNRTAYFTNHGSYATASSVPLVDGTLNTFVATVDGHDTDGNPRVDSDVRESNVLAYPGPQVTSLHNYDNQRLTACAVDCFAAVQRLSTVPYYSLDTPRNVSLVYHQDRVAPRPFLHAYVVHPAAASNTPSEFRMQAKVNGSFVTFLNGEQTLRFQGTRSAVRLGGQFDAGAIATGVYPLEIIVTAVYPGGASKSSTHTTRIAIVNEAPSPIARGWTIAGLQRVHFVLGNGSLLVTEGDGSAVFFDGGSMTAPLGEYSRMIKTGTGTSTVYTRLYPDSTKAQFNHLGQLISVTDRFSNTVTYEYDGTGRLTKITDPFRTYGGLPSYISLSYGSYGLTEIREPGPSGSQTGGRVTYVRVNSDSTLRAFVDPDGDSTRFTWDSGTRLLASVIDRAGSATAYAYHGTSHKVDSIVLPAVLVDAGSGTTQGPVSPVRRFTPWQLGGVPYSSTTTPVAPLLYDSVRATVTDADGHTTTLAITHRYGLATRLTDAIGRTTTVTYREMLVTNVSHPTGSSDIYDYSSNGLLTSAQRSGEPAITMIYGAYGQPQQITRQGTELQYFYLGTGGRADSVRIGGSSSASKMRNTFDTRGRLLITKDPENHVTRYHYDAMFGNLDSTLVSGNRFTRVRFDRFGRDSAQNAAGQPWRRTMYDDLNRAIEYHDGVNSNPTRYGYDKLFLIRVQDPKNQVYRVERNALGWVTRQFDPADTLNRYSSIRYSVSGLPTSQTNRRGQRVDLGYDAAHRVVSKTGPANVVADSFAYSSDSRRVVAWNAVSRDSVFLSSNLWTDSVVTRIAGKRFRLQYQKHWGMPAVIAMNVATDAGITFATQGLGTAGPLLLPDTLKVNGQATYVTRNGDFTVDTTTWPSGVARVDSRTNLHRPFRSSYSDSTINSYLWRGYQYDNQNRIAEVITPGLLGQLEVMQYGYTGLNQLASSHGVSVSSCSATDTIKGYNCVADNATPTKVYSYDAAGNRTDPASATYGLGNRIERADWRSFEHDFDGNMTRQYDNTGNAFDARYYWSADGLLDSVIIAGDTLHFEYNPSGRLVRKSRNGVIERHFLWDRDQLLAELDGSATSRIAEYVYRPGTDRPLALVTGSQTIAAVRYFAQDELGRVTGVVNGTAVDQRVHYSAEDWGHAATSGTLADTNRLRWKGLPYDPDARLYYVRNRWYEPYPLVGRFISEDPIGLEGGMNLYAFAGSDPINGWDPLGLDFCGNHGLDDHPDQRPGTPKPRPGAPPNELPPVAVETYTHDCSAEREAYEALQRFVRSGDVVGRTNGGRRSGSRSRRSRTAATAVAEFASCVATASAENFLATQEGIDNLLAKAGRIGLSVVAMNTTGSSGIVGTLGGYGIERSLYPLIRGLPGEITGSFAAAPAMRATSFGISFTGRAAVGIAIGNGIAHSAAVSGALYLGIGAGSLATGIGSCI